MVNANDIDKIHIACRSKGRAHCELVFYLTIARKLKSICIVHLKRLKPYTRKSLKLLSRNNTNFPHGLC